MVILGLGEEHSKRAGLHEQAFTCTILHVSLAQKASHMAEAVPVWEENAPGPGYGRYGSLGLLRLGVDYLNTTRDLKSLPEPDTVECVCSPMCSGN